jgi:acylphosphatase
MIARRVIFRGHVQGVGFRHTVRSLACGFEVSGWVRNQADGSVEMEVAGASGEVAAFIREIVEESSVAHHIKSHLVTPIPVTPGAGGFVIRRD